jgi:hypothetical protein
MQFYRHEFLRNYWKERKKELVDETNLVFGLLHIFFKVSPCGYAKVMGAYKVKRKDEKIHKMILLGLLHIQI